MNCNLDDLYLSFADQDFLNDFKNLENEILNYNEYTKKENLDLTIILQKEIILKNLFVKLGGFINLTTSTDVSHPSLFLKNERKSKKRQ